MALAPTLITNLIDLTELEVITNEDHPMDMGTDEPTSSGLATAQPAPKGEPTKKGKEIKTIMITTPPPQVEEATES
jgi:hypothetical protein